MTSRRAGRTFTARAFDSGREHLASLGPGKIVGHEVELDHCGLFAFLQVVLVYFFGGPGIEVGIASIRAGDDAVGISGSRTRQFHFPFARRPARNIAAGLAGEQVSPLGLESRWVRRDVSAVGQRRDVVVGLRSRVRDEAG